MVVAHGVDPGPHPWVVLGSYHGVHLGDPDPNPVEGPPASTLHPSDLGVLGLGL